MSPECSRGPLSPDKIMELKAEQIPEEVYVAFNGLIAQNLQRHRSVVLQKHVVAQLIKQGMDEGEIFRKHWLDVEDSYREVGWGVKFDQPVGYAGENFEPYFEFTKE